VLWWVLLSPMLAPGIVLGLSALVFWGRLGVNAGLFTIIMAQTTFVAGYPMLVLMARLQRQPVELEEAALDLGASPFRVFWRLTLPYLAPALISAGVIAFMASMENYNTTMFAKGGSCTFATEIGAMGRNPNGHPPVINAVGTIIIVLTVLAATAHTPGARHRRDPRALPPQAARAVARTGASGGGLARLAEIHALRGGRPHIGRRGGAHVETLPTCD
jgi:spermidine/putrescine transport system permease protein